MKLITLLIIPLLLGCQSESTDSNAKQLNLKDYFYNCDEYSTPKVLIYEVDSLGVKSNIYYKVRQIDSDKLELVRYDKSFNKQAVLVDKFNTNGVELLDSYSTNNNDSVFNISQIINGKIFNYETTNQIGIIDVIVTGSNQDGNWKRKSLSHWNYSDSTEILIGDNLVKTIIGKGVEESEFSIGTEKYLNTMDIETWYSKGIGVSKLIYKFPNGIYSETYLKTISVKTFEEIKK
jgi:hypothetical protein